MIEQRDLRIVHYILLSWSYELEKSPLWQERNTGVNLYLIGAIFDPLTGDRELIVPATLSSIVKLKRSS